MPKLNHQAEELAKAFSGLIDIERTKAKLDVYTIIKDGLETNKAPLEILNNISQWIGQD